MGISSTSSVGGLEAFSTTASSLDELSGPVPQEVVRKKVVKKSSRYVRKDPIPNL
jgi:hypothetical protein